MIRPWEKFTAVEHQIGIDYIAVVRRSRSILIAEIGTTQKYPEVLGYSSTEIHLLASERTPLSQLEGQPSEATSIIFPRAVRGWNVITPDRGRYSLTITLYKPSRHRSPEKLIRRDEEWRIALITRGES